MIQLQRVDGSLAVSRDLGEFDYKDVKGKHTNKQLVNPSQQDNLLILSFNRILDIMINEDICEINFARIKVNEKLETVAIYVVIYKDSRENMGFMGIIMIAFTIGSKPDPAKEEHLNQRLIKPVMKVCSYLFVLRIETFIL